MKIGKGEVAHVLEELARVLQREKRIVNDNIVHAEIWHLDRMFRSIVDTASGSSSPLDHRRVSSRRQALVFE